MPYSIKDFRGHPHLKGGIYILGKTVLVARLLQIPLA